MALTITPSSSGTSLYSNTISYSISGSLSLPSNCENFQITVSFYVGYNAYYNGQREYPFAVYLQAGYGAYSETKYVSTYPSSNRGYVTATFSWPLSAAGYSITSITLHQTDRYNNNSSYYSTSQSSNNTINLDSYTEYHGSMSAPSSISVSPTQVAPSTSATLSWSGAFGGINNNITGYYIYRATSASGSYSYLTSVSTSSGSGSVSVTSPSSNGYYYYKVITQGSYSNSGYSSYASLRTYTSVPSAPTGLSLSVTYATVSESVTLSWTASSGGTNNPVLGYYVYKNGTLQNAAATTATSYGVTANATAGNSDTYTVVAYGAYGNSSASSGITLYTYSNPGAPTAVSVSSTNVAPGTSVTLSWSGATAGSNNAITGYLIYRSTSAGSAGSQIEDISSTATSGAKAVTAPTTGGTSYYYRVYTKGARSNSLVSIVYATLTSLSYSTVSPPTSVSLNPTMVVPSGTSTLTWSGATAGSNNAISSYIVYRCTTLGGTYTALSGGQTTSTSLEVTAPTSGSYYYKVQTIGNITGYDSSLSTAVATLSVNRSPGAPSDLAASPTTYESGNITLTWTAGTDPDSNLSTYNVQYATSADGTTWGSWTTWTSISNTSYANSLTLTRGHYAKFRIQSVDTLGATSSWVESNSIQKNTVPTSDQITFACVSDTGTVNSLRPRILITIAGSESIDVTISGYTGTKSGAQSPGTQILFYKTSDAPVDNTDVNSTVTITDSLGASTTLTYIYQSLQHTYTDPTLVAHSSSADGTPVKAAHMNEIRELINDVRTFYGMESTTWAASIVAGTTYLADWTTHVNEIRTSINQIITYVNGWDTSTTNGNITSPTWITISSNCPKASVITQIRSVLATL